MLPICFNADFFVVFIPYFGWRILHVSLVVESRGSTFACSFRSIERNQQLTMDLFQRERAQETKTTLENEKETIRYDFFC
jgi:hypothetical protein